MCQKQLFEITNFTFEVRENTHQNDLKNARYAVAA
jgi:hypothetical protein